MNAVSAPPILRVPTLEDGPRIHALVAQCPPLDTNSRYCNLLQCHHFADTSIVAVLGQNLIGAITGYCLPRSPETLFVWQVAVHPDGRGKGIARSMLIELLKRATTHGVNRLETTITLSNTGSWSLFRGLARDLATPLKQHKLFDKDRHLAGVSASEYRVELGPFTALALNEIASHTGTANAVNPTKSLSKELSS